MENKKPAQPIRNPIISQLQLAHKLTQILKICVNYNIIFRLLQTKIW